MRTKIKISYFLPIVILFGHVFLSSCRKELGTEVTKEFSLFANEAITRTTLNSDWSVSWINGDALTVFNGANGEFSKSVKFNINGEPSNGLFKADETQSINLLSGREAYDWYVCYPYLKYASNPAGTKGYTISREPKQVGYYSRAHISVDDLMAGKALNVEDGVIPNIPLYHVGALHKITIKNECGVATPITEVIFDASESGTYITGSYTMIYGDASTTPSLDLNPSTMGTKSYTSTVKIVNKDKTPISTVVPVGESIHVYFVTAPFTMSAGKKIVITIKGGEGDIVIEKPFNRDVTFEAGTYNTTTISYREQRTFPPSSESSIVQVEKSINGEWQLLVNNAIFKVKGASTNNFYSDVNNFGGNAIRLYSANSEDTQTIMDEAYRSWLMVYLGLGMKAAKGFDYSNAAGVANQKEAILNLVKKYKDHPSLLCWSLGNEIEASNDDNIDMWQAVGDLAAAVKAIDPNHPVTIALAGASQKRVKNLKQYAPAIDFISFNSYYPNVGNCATTLSTAGVDLPYMVTEFGPRGTWAMNPEPNRILPWSDGYSESSKALVEETSTEKEAIYRKIYQDDIEANSSNGCLGSFVFLWGYQKHGEVLNWYGTHTKDRYSFGVCDAMSYCWSGSYPVVRAPRIESRSDITMNGKVAEDAIYVSRGSSNSAKVVATAPNGVTLRYRWFIVKEGDSESDGSLPLGIQGLIANHTLPEISFNAPSDVGAYRLYIYVLDDLNKKAASGCIPFYVKN